jgi:uncharacterized protein YraI
MHRTALVTAVTTAHIRYTGIVAAIVLALCLASITTAQTTMTGTVTRNANLRSGPGTTYAVSGAARAGDAVTIVDATAAGDWYELDSGKWIAAFLVELDDDNSGAATPTPTATATTVPAITSSDLRQYLAQILPTILEISDALQKMSSLLQSPQIGNDNWTLQLATQFVVIRLGHETLQAITPTSSLAAVHRQILSATQDCNDATYAIADGLDNFDTDELTRGAALLSTCAEKSTALQVTLRQLQTPTPTPTRAVTLTPTRAPNTATPTPTRIAPTATRTATPPTPVTRQNTIGAIALQNANLREGPGTTYAVSGSLAAGDEITPVGRNAAYDWIQLDTGAWVSIDLVAGLPLDLPVTAVSTQLTVDSPPSTPTPGQAAALPPTPAWQTEQNGVIFTSECPCDQGNTLNCGDFGISRNAHACYLRCLELTGHDVHQLDRDKDGAACEWKW